MIGVLNRIWRDPGGRAGLLLVAAVLLLGLAGPWMVPHDPNKLSILARFCGPSAAHWLGTDHLGRDLLSRLADGGRVALLVALSTIAVALAAGTLLGIAAAYAPPAAERAILAVFDIVSAFPSLVFALAVVALMGPGLDKVILIVAVTLVPHFGRVARAQTLSLRNSPFLEAERVLGASPLRIALHHLVPNILGPLVVLASMDVPVVITIEAGLSFLGVGVPPPRASWGTLLHDGYITLSQSPWPVIAAGAVLTLATLGFTLFGEALRDALDPKADPKADPKLRTEP
ncbi:ABC transporter permease subunit [Azospirillum melinis]|uniref:ABC transporter permease subunit n=1 Tax=Azospirillum melinis TaxID=328839 RepID=A0ABX2K9H1_9PROT|nr:ABC transporter permease [Azospirillum melinis]MBP2305820.1 peptide/nickel transport system permease protein [Azospirillum melinis]NUA99111.1 ABC transporter permease subunit [Azospirillum melinis]